MELEETAILCSLLNMSCSFDYHLTSLDLPQEPGYTRGAISEVLDHLPLCALVKSRIFCVSGGLSPRTCSLEQLRRIPRPTAAEGDELVTCKLNNTLFSVSFVCVFLAL